MGWICSPFWKRKGTMKQHSTKIALTKRATNWVCTISLAGWKSRCWLRVLRTSIRGPAQWTSRPRQIRAPRDGRTNQSAFHFLSPFWQRPASKLILLLYQFRPHLGGGRIRPKWTIKIWTRYLHTRPSRHKRNWIKIEIRYQWCGRNPLCCRIVEWFPKTIHKHCNRMQNTPWCLRVGIRFSLWFRKRTKDQIRAKTYLMSH